MGFSIKKQGFLYTSKSIFLKKGFTIREILIVIVVLSIGLLSVVVVLTDGMEYVQKTRQKVIALNLAREGMEAVYQIRDTNRMRRAGVKDSCWLKINPLLDEGGSDCFTDDLRFTSGAYILQRSGIDEQYYFTLTGPFVGVNLTDRTIDSGDLNFSLCQQSGYWYPCPGVLPTTNEGKYFRQIEGRGLYLKDMPSTGGNEIICTGSLGPDVNCNNTRAKEFRFCSKVVYMGIDIGEVELCGVITNFKGE